MKKLILFFAALFLLTSCSFDEDNPQFHVAFVPVVGVEMPEYFVHGENYEIKVKYQRPTDCYFYDGFHYEEKNNALVIAVQTLVIEDSNCASLDGVEPEEASFTFACSPTYGGSSYLFKFYTGKNEDGTNSYMEVEVPIAQ
ncbi:membrane lipoprotein lipid attachment site-containing protein [Flavobacterium beibuense]|nr:membrane lipoprotein lipid attachment site-containing protein [Flavobacterium beibuense]